MSKPRSDGRYTATKRMDGRKIYGYGPTPEAAKADLEAKLAEIVGMTINPETLHDAAKLIWRPRIENLSDGTYRRYEGIYLRHIKPAFGHCEPKAVKAVHVQNFVNKLSQSKALDKKGKPTDKTLSPKGVRCIYGVLANLFKTLENADALDRTPCRGIVIPKAPEKRERYLEPHEAHELLHAADGTELALPIFLALVLGLRRGEVVGLRWSDLNRRRMELRIGSQRKHTKSGVERSTLKTSSSKRTLRLTAGFVDYIDRNGNLDSDHLATKDGKPWRPNQLTREFHEFAKDNLPGWTYHDLRHGAAGLIQAATNDPTAAQVVLGHSNVDMTMTYISRQASRTGAAFELLDTLLLGPKSG